MRTSRSRSLTHSPAEFAPLGFWGVADTTPDSGRSSVMGRTG